MTYARLVYQKIICDDQMKIVKKKSTPPLPPPKKKPKPHTNPTTYLIHNFIHKEMLYLVRNMVFNSFGVFKLFTLPCDKGPHHLTLPWNSVFYYFTFYSTVYIYLNVKCQSL